MANIPPVAVLTVSPTSLVLPANTVTLDGTGSHDDNLNGVIIKYVFYRDGNVISSSSVTKVVVTTVSTPGNHLFELEVTDRGLLKNKASVTVQVTQEANIAPVAVLKVIPAEITLPANLVTLDGSDSYDPNLNGVIKNFNFSKDGNVLLNANNVQVLTTMVNTAGTHNFSLVVTDRGGLTDSDAGSIIVHSALDSPIEWGAIIADGSPEEKIAVIKAFGGTCIRFTEELIHYTDHSPMFEKCTAAGLKCVVCLVWQTVSSNGGNPNQFVRPAQYTAYAAKTNLFLNKYKPECVVIENEPTTEVFWDDNISFYIDQLAYIVPVVKSHNVKVADGAIHVVYIEQVIGGGNLTGNAAKVRDLIEAYTTIPLDFVNIHTNASGNSVPLNFMSVAANYVRAQTGKKIMSNEWHLEPGGTANLMTTMVNAWKQAKPVYCMVYSSSSGQNVPISNGTNLTQVGLAYKEAIK